MMTTLENGESQALRPRYTLLEVAARFPAPDPARSAALLAAELATDHNKVVVLDDDPTGVQTVHGISVYTDGAPESIGAGFDEPNRIFFILTNSRSLSREDTRLLHADIAHNLEACARERGRGFLLISRSDSTMRGHYPIETETLRETLEAETGRKIDGEILCPFFLAGGRLTVGGVHHVLENGVLVPAGETEFARDRTFGYRSSDLREWIEEKTGGAYPASGVELLPLAALRAFDLDGLTRTLMGVHDFGKVVVDALEYADIEVAATAILRAVRAGRSFIFRSAAGLARVLGGVSDKGLLTREDLLPSNSTAPGDNAPGDTSPSVGGLVIVGSHVAKTTAQLNRLLALDGLDAIEFDVAAVAQGREDIAADLLAADVSARIAAGRTVAVFTSRNLLTSAGGSAEDDLALSVRVSRALVRLVSGLTVRPRFLIAKGGITSSDIGVRALCVRRATVLGQALPGVPVWKLGAESRYPGLAYVVFPGNVGDEDALRQLVQTMMPAR
jgi:uncharacterized protein YgbK (DUF1537 family)